MSNNDKNNIDLANGRQSVSPADAPPTQMTGGNEEEGGAVNPLELVRDRLEGRWLYAIISAVILGISAACIAWLVAPINYTAEGFLKGNSKNETVVQKIDETGDTKGFMVFLESQVMLVKSPDVVERAINSTEMKQLLDVRGRNALIAQIKYNMKPTVYGETELIKIEFTDSSPAASATITNSILNSYIALHGSLDEDRRSRTKQQLRTFKTENRTTTENKRQQQQSLIRQSKYGIVDVGNFVTENANEMATLEDQKKLIEETIEKLKKRVEEEGREIKGDDIAVPKLAQLEKFEPNLKSKQQDIDKVKIEYDQLRSRLSDKHRQVRILESTIKSMQANLVRRMEETKQKWYEGPGKEQSFNKLQENIRKIGKKVTEKRDEIDAMNTMRDRYEALQRSIDDLDIEFAVLDDRLRGIEFEEDALEDRISIAQFALTPTESTKDKRPQIAGVAFVGCVIGVFALFFLLGTVDQRAFAMRQLQSDKGRFQCLGVVPDTGPTSDDPEALEIAMGCIHRLRNRLQSLNVGTGDRGFVMLISSPFQGDGKTTIATLLGWSYAEAGYRTCMVDCDFIGRSLSHQFGKLNDKGLKESIKSGSIDDHIIALGNSNLSILPIGIDEGINAEHVPIDAIRKLLDQLREKFDMVIMDTGPLSGSIESTPIALTVDGVLLTLRKGRSRLPLRRCVQELRELGAPYLGVILNYADRSDYRHFSSTSKSITDLIREEKTGERKRNPLTDRIASSSQSRRAEERSDF
jgi:Mrp family chromosome partitioning ATPase/uncharacterized protein involved in exopolysaccharide biosynthesis